VFIYHTGVEIQQEVNLATQKFNIKLLVPSPEGFVEEWLKCEDVSLKPLKALSTPGNNPEPVITHDWFCRL